jgi:hypothetical protein
LIDDQAVIGHGDEVTADAEEAADLEDREQGMSLVLADDKVVYLADTLVLIIDDSVSAELA